MSAIEQLDELQGYVRAEEKLQPALVLLSADFDVMPGLRNSVPYDDENGRPTDFANVEINYLLKHRPPLAGVPAEELLAANSAFFTRVEELWDELGHRTITRTVEQPFRVLRAQDPRDGFIIALKQGKIGNLWMTASSAPVLRTGATPPPPVWT
ncbi:hypothetical protein LX16_1098 [Stackebrandtia albiflava]|uniref:Uncharacterized protein n=1 Tax=Stackebrandtia albiflava TaxID=406432 RepID=A0A562VBY3_9ACTN|nr:hypothetical protein [Stackebrandtia albiflava]TWJ15395.1 hypothetical protein LX16_1098 [Stackebrandtia albiflava]